MKRNTRALARRLFPQWPRRKQAEWVRARMRVDSGTWKFPIGEKHIDAADIPHFLRVLPFGPPLEIIDTPYDKRVKAVRLVKGLLGGQR